MDEKNYNENLHRGSNVDTFQNARELREAETEAERKLWPLLRNRQLKGKKFRRQHAFSNYILDFYCHECKLAIEVDGQVHKNAENQQYDAARTTLLNDYGIKVIRFWNNEVLHETEKVLNKIAGYL